MSLENAFDIDFSLFGDETQKSIVKECGYIAKRVIKAKTLKEPEEVKSIGIVDALESLRKPWKMEGRPPPLLQLYLIDCYHVQSVINNEI